MNYLVTIRIQLVVDCNEILHFFKFHAGEQVLLILQPFTGYKHNTLFSDTTKCPLIYCLSSIKINKYINDYIFISRDRSTTTKMSAYIIAQLFQISIGSNNKHIMKIQQVLCLWYFKKFIIMVINTIYRFFKPDGNCSPR